METNMDAKLWRSIGNFAGEVGVEALICVEQTLWWDGKRVDLVFTGLDLVYEKLAQSLIDYINEEMAKLVK